MYTIRVITTLLLLHCSVAFMPTALKGRGNSRIDIVVSQAMQNQWKKKGPMESAGGPGNVMAAATVPVQFKVELMHFLPNIIKLAFLCASNL